MADNVTLPTTGTGTADVVAASDDVSGVHYPYVKLVDGTADSTAKIPGDASNGLDVDVTRVQGTVTVQGSVAHDDIDSGNPVKIGARAVAHAATPTAVAAADRTDLIANRHGVLFVLGGHPNTQTIRVNYTSAQTDTAIVSVSAGTRIVVTAITATVANATTAAPSVIVGFGTANTPTGAGVVLGHPGIPGGGGVNRGDGSGILGIGGDDEDLRITSGAPTGGSITVVVTYFTIAT